MEKSKLNGYEFITTADGSVTAFSHRFNEACHSTAGAVQETWTHYIEGCQIQQITQEPIAILEVGFGVGIGFLETLKALHDKKFTFISMEIDEDLIKWVVAHHPELAKMQKDAHGNYSLQTNQFHLLILVGDARVTVPKFLEGMQFKAIYQDAFSPKRNPWLWTVQWFEQLKDLADEDCIMATYSASSSIRKAMIAAGWKVQKGAKFGPKRSSTRAVLKGETDPEIQISLNRSGAPLLTDEIAESYKMEEANDEKNQAH